MWVWIPVPGLTARSRCEGIFLLGLPRWQASLKMLLDGLRAPSPPSQMLWLRYQSSRPPQISCSPVLLKLARCFSPTGMWGRAIRYPKLLSSCPTVPDRLLTHF